MIVATSVYAADDNKGTGTGQDSASETATPSIICDSDTLLKGTEGGGEESNTDGQGALGL